MDHVIIPKESKLGYSVLNDYSKHLNRSLGFTSVLLKK